MAQLNAAGDQFSSNRDSVYQDHSLAQTSAEAGKFLSKRGKKYLKDMSSYQRKVNYRSKHAGTAYARQHEAPKLPKKPAER